MNVFLSPEEKTAEPLQASGTVHAVLPDAPDEKTVAALLETAENEEQKRRVTVRLYNGIRNTFIFVFLAVLSGFVFSSLFTHSGPVVAKYSVYLLGTSYALHFVLNHFFVQNAIEGHGKTHRKAVAALLQHPHDPRTLLPFIDGLHTSKAFALKKHTRHFSAPTDHLWNLPAPDAALSLDETRRATLRNTLSNAYTMMANGKWKTHGPHHFDDATTDLAVAIMKTLAGLGDKKTEKVLRKIIKAEAVTPNETVVRDAAREYLPVLVQKIAQNENLQLRILQCLGGSSARDGQQMLSDFLNTFAPEDAKAALVELLHVRRNKQIVLTNIVRGALLSYAALCLYSSAAQGNKFGLLTGVCVFMQINSAAPTLVAQLHSSDNGKLIYELTKRSENDTHLIPLLLTAIPIFLALEQVDAVRKALARLLPLLQPGDAALIPPAQRAYLRAWLKMPRFGKQKGGSGSQTLTIAALDALAAVGDTKALPASEKIARQTLHGNYHETELHEAALRCVEALRARKS